MAFFICLLYFIFLSSSNTKTLHKGVSTRDAILSVEKTVHSIGDDLRKMSTIKMDERKSVVFSGHENEMLNKLTKLIRYLKNKCAPKSENCKSQDIDTFKEELELLFSNIKKSKETSLNFLEEFEEKQKALYNDIKNNNNNNNSNNINSNNKVNNNYYFYYIDNTNQLQPVTTIIPEYKTTTTTSGENCQNGRGYNYAGIASTTKSGLSCQKWTSQSPHKHGFGALGDHNFCRNPDGEPGVWCYTTDSNKKWELCDVPVCEISTTATLTTGSFTNSMPDSSTKLKSCRCPNSQGSSSSSSSSSSFSSGFFCPMFVSCSSAILCDYGYCSDCSSVGSIDGEKRAENIVYEEELKIQTVPLEIEDAGKLEFLLVHVDDRGPAATVAEVKANLENVTRVLEINCDLVQLDGGSVRKTGEISEVLNNTCKNECTQKIIKKEEPPPVQYNLNVADICCFIIQSWEEGGSSQTYILTSHSALETFPRETCPEDCMYTLLEDLPDVSTQLCLDQIVNQSVNYTCCSERTGTFCRTYGEGTHINTMPDGICSSTCTEIADCSSNSNNAWCESKELIQPTNVFESNLRSEVHCNPIIPEPVNQTAEYYPAALPNIPSPSESSRCGGYCGYWNLWRYTCWNAFCYPTYYYKKNYYRIWYGRKAYDYYFKHACCAAFQPYCNRRYSCPGC